MTVPPWVCPRCRGALIEIAAALVCRACSTEYPIIAGIPDLRIHPDPYIGIAEDRAKALRLAGMAKTLGFAELVRYYYRITPEVPPDRASRYLAHHLAGVSRGEAMLQRAARYSIAPGGSATLLDLGCGTAGFLAAAAAAGVPALCGIDVALRWLVIARSRLHDLGIGGVRLAAASAEALPLPDGTFDFISAETLLEHTPRAEEVLREIARVRKRGGAVMIRTVNRFSLGPEPHVGVWGVGFLPRRWMDPYVRWRKGIPYVHIHLRSWRELRGLVRSVGGMSVRVPELTPADYAHQGPAVRRLLDAFEWLARNVAPVRPLLARIAPWIDVVGGGDRF